MAVRAGACGNCAARVVLAMNRRAARLVHLAKHIMAPWLKIVMWTAIVVLPGGLLLLPLVLADRVQAFRRRPAEQRAQAHGD